ncbi:MULTISPECIES: ABC-F family ATP-binding cassette domain-containing protein [Spiroplasma]|uniref:ABC-F family ATP-binding cassette domain-containing protein n=1 Tax=Spiroplasma TaxID=2132 RepID=UPI0018DE581C|nr:MULTISPECIES: ABC-F family ATP-binding cassette domain-containing protein [Spiroplasma]MBH8622598.1 ABC transporter ATP-binding protein [Spiroplasma sp. hyd1]UNF61474.1 ATP-binding cassette domain-containing protein [Spiroplasma poulsonii]
MSLINIENLSHANGGKILYKNATVRINKGEHLALIGTNGTGKTTLLSIIYGKITPDEGMIDLQPKVKIAYLDQHQELDGSLTVDQFLKLTYQHLFDIEQRIYDIYEKMSANYDEDKLVKALKLQEHLDQNGFETIDKEIRSLVDELGIDPTRLDAKLSELSGGQRGKVILAKLLLSENDFLLLDEPTNFLDLEQVEWLAKFLQSYDKAFLVVSHDIDFINKVGKVIYAIENLTVNRYVGNYQQYLALSELKNEQYDKAQKGQERLIKKLETYVAKNKARASTAKSAQSRQKQIDKMEIIEKRHELTKPKFSFKYKRPASTIIVSAEKLEIGYQFPLIQPLTFDIRDGEKCIVRGYNGIGKTTFLNTLAGNIPSLGGTLKLGNGVVIAYFHQIEAIMDMTPIEYLKNLYPELEDGRIRSILANFGVKNTLMQNQMIKLSGGEQTKVRLSALSLEPCSLLILDEPTNHIDVLAKEALLEAIQAFEGTVLITTHDINFNVNWADKVLDFEKMI